MTGIGENTLAQPVKPPLRERRACLAKLVKNRLTLTCTNTPTREHFDLGTPEHEAENRRAYQRRLDESAAGKMREEASTWCPKWPEPEKKNGSKPGGKFSGLSLD